MYETEQSRLAVRLLFGTHSNDEERSSVRDIGYNYSCFDLTLLRGPQVQGLQSLLQRWKMRAAPAAKPWPAGYTSMLSRQAEMAMLNGDFEHFDETGAELLAGKEVAVLPMLLFAASLADASVVCICCINGSCHVPS